MMPPGPTQLPLAMHPRLEMLPLQEFLGPIERAGGSMQLVCDRIEKETEEVFAQRLAAFFEPKADLSYSSKENMQMEDDVEHIVRLVDLCYSSLATTKGPPRLHTCLSIADSIFTDGFITQSDPLLIWKNPKTMQHPYFWASYVKGHARASTALAMAVILMDNFPDAAAMERIGGANLLESLKGIRVRVAMCAQDVMAVAFKNAQLAYRGSMRKAHDVLAWIQKLEKVSAATGVPPADVLAKWNQDCPSEARVTGNKRLCCLNILQQLNTDTRVILTDHFSKFGSNSAFTDDAFTSKKILPGTKPRMQSPRWVRWLTTSNGSFQLMLRHIIQKHESAAEASRGKVSKEKIERSSEMACLVLGVTNDVLEAHPGLPRQELENAFVGGFIQNDPNIVMALEAALTDADKNFDVMALPVVNDAVCAWQKTQAMDPNAAVSTAGHMRIDATAVEEQEFKLWRLRAMQDIEKFVAWAKVMKDRQAQIYYKKMQHNIMRAEECAAAARSLLDASSPNCSVTLITKSDEVQRTFPEAIARIKQHLVRTLLIQE